MGTGSRAPVFVTCSGTDTARARGVSAPEVSADEEAVVRRGLLAAQVCAQLWPHRPCGLRVALGCVGPSASGGEECSLCRDRLG